MSAPNGRDHYGFAVVGHGVDRIDFICRDVQSDLSDLRATAKIRGERRWVIKPETREEGPEWGGLDLRDGTSVFLDNDLRHLPVGGAMKFVESALVHEVLQKHNINAAPPVVRRLDLTTDVGFKDATEAQRALVALSAVMVAQHKIVIHHAKGSKKIETVSWKLGKRIRLRIYDSVAHNPERAVEGYESVLRFEHQYTPAKSDQVAVEALMERDFSGLVTAPLTLGQDGSRVVADLHALNMILKQRSPPTNKGDAKAERQLGTLVRAYLGGRNEWNVKRTADDRATEMRKLGLSLHPDLPEPVDLGPLLATVRAAWIS